VLQILDNVLESGGDAYELAHALWMPD
jgi:hypothetical protein